jgi:hypothetical protein
MAGDLTPVPNGYLANAVHYGLTREATAAVAGMLTFAPAEDVAAAAKALNARGVEPALAKASGEFACALLMLAEMHENNDDPTGRGTASTTPSPACSPASRGSRRSVSGWRPQRCGHLRCHTPLRT